MASTAYTANTGHTVIMIYRRPVRRSWRVWGNSGAKQRRRCKSKHTRVHTVIVIVIVTFYSKSVTTSTTIVPNTSHSTIHSGRVARV
jgi:hypothetical protein